MKQSIKTKANTNVVSFRKDLNKVKKMVTPKKEVRYGISKEVIKEAKVKNDPIDKIAKRVGKKLGKLSNDNFARVEVTSVKQKGNTVQVGVKLKPLSDKEVDDAVREFEREYTKSRVREVVADIVKIVLYIVFGVPALLGLIFMILSTVLTAFDFGMWVGMWYLGFLAFLLYMLVTSN